MKNFNGGGRGVPVWQARVRQLANSKLVNDREKCYMAEVLVKYYRSTVEVLTAYCGNEPKNTPESYGIGTREVLRRCQIGAKELQSVSSFGVEPIFGSGAKPVSRSLNNKEITAADLREKRLILKGFRESCKDFRGKVEYMLLLPMIFCVLFNPLVLYRASAQEQSGAVLVGKVLSAADEQNFAKTQKKVNVSYKYIFDEQANKYNEKHLSAEKLANYPLIIYDLDYKQTPNVKIGDTLPTFLKAISFQYVDETGATKIGTLNEFMKGKLLVLDFWATWCSPCVESVDKWNSIAKEMGRDIQVLAIMLDHDFHSQYFGVNRKWISPIVFGPECNIINSFFFERAVISRMAWVMDGRLIAITGTKGYDLQMVRDLLADKPVDIPIADEWTYSQPKS